MFLRKKNQDYKIDELQQTNPQALILSSQNTELFACPYWKDLALKKKEAEQQSVLLEQQYKTLKIEHEHSIAQLQTRTAEQSLLQSKIETLTNEVTSLMGDLKTLQNTHDALQKQFEKTEQENNKQKQQLSSYKTQEANEQKKIPELQVMVQRLNDYETKDVLSTNTQKIVKNIRECLESIVILDDRALPGVIPFSIKITELLLKDISTIQKPNSDFIKDAEKQIKAVKSQICSNDTCDDRIPLHFLKISEIFIDKANDYLKENKTDLAYSQQLASLEVLNAIKALYEDQTFRIHLNALHGRKQYG